MADHFYSFPTAGDTTRRQRSDITVGTSDTSGDLISVRITDASLSPRQVAEALDFLRDLVIRRDFQVIATDTLL